MFGYLHFFAFYLNSQWRRGESCRLAVSHHVGFFLIRWRNKSRIKMYRCVLGVLKTRQEKQELAIFYFFYFFFYREKELLTRLNMNYTLIEVIYVCFCVSLVSLSVVMSRTLFSALHSLILMHK